jgi:hypothetical protein
MIRLGGPSPRRVVRSQNLRHCLFARSLFLDCPWTFFCSLLPPLLMSSRGSTRRTTKKASPLLGARSAVSAMQNEAKAALRAALSAKAEALKLMKAHKAPSKPRMSPAVGSDGLSSSMITTNNTVIEDVFRLRREKVCDVYGTTAPFAAAANLYINPGNSTLFPIFSGIAGTYEQYRVNHLRFVFESQAYTASGSAQSAGLVGMATNFDPDDPTFSSMTELENYVGSVKGPPYARKMAHDVAKAHGLRRGSRQGGVPALPLNNYFVNSSANASAPAGRTSKFYDVGLFQIATSNNSGAAVVGELFVEYGFTMIRPKAPPTGSDPATGFYHATFSGGTLNTSGPNFFVAGTVSSSEQNLPLALTGPCQVTFPSGVVGRFFVHLDWWSPASNNSLVGTTVTYTGGISGVAAFGLDAPPRSTQPNAISTIQGSAQIIVDVTAAGAITFTNIKMLAGSDSTVTGDLVVIQIPNVLTAPEPGFRAPPQDREASNARYQADTDDVGPSVQSAARLRPAVALPPSQGVGGARNEYHPAGCECDQCQSLRYGDGHPRSSQSAQRHFFDGAEVIDAPTGPVTQASTPSAQSSQRAALLSGAIPTNPRTSLLARGPYDR